MRLIEMPLIDLIPATESDVYWSERGTRAMGSRARVVAGDAPDGVVDWAMSELERLEQCWSRFRDDSELAQLNARSGEWTDVSTSMLLALTCALDLHEATAGRFDPTILDALERIGYDRTFEAVAPDGHAGSAYRQTAIPAPGFSEIEIDIDEARVKLPRGARVDLGGLGKGLAADLVARGMVDRGARTALVGMGGDLRARGEAPEGAWNIPVLDPFDAGDERVAFEFPLTEDAIVTSTTRMRTWTRSGQRFHHLIDPHTGASTSTGVAAVVASARDAWWAEGIAKSVIVAGVEAGLELADAAGVRVWLFLDDGRVIDHAPA